MGLSRSVGKVTPYSFRKAMVLRLSSCEMPTTVMFWSPWALCRRSRYGNAYWQTGQDTLKKAARTGPFLRASCNENVLPSTAAREMSGAFVPAVNAAISCEPPKRRLSHFMNSGLRCRSQVSENQKTITPDARRLDDASCL